ncbi:MAG TPA: SGNH/GDSL hydrolase family protein [Planctomycetota bacterium]|nr:SGNH/GDSL hydrolase family protein [Planctomycetota bacterium]
MLRKLLVRGALILGTLLFALVVLEVGLRLNGWGEKPSRYFDPDIGMRFHGNQTRDTFGKDGPPVSYSVNQAGLRGPWYDGPKPPGVTRVICLGDSFTFSWGAQDEEAWPWLLERMLEERLGPGRAQVANFGFPMLNTRAELNAYHKLARDKDWDVMLLGWYLNDIERIAGGVRYTEHWIFQALSGLALMEYFHYRIRPKIGWFDVVRSPELLEAIALYQKHYAEIESDPDGELGRPFWERGMADLRDLVREVRADGVKLAVIVFPSTTQVSPLHEALARSPADGEALIDGPLGAPQRRVLAVLQELDVPTIDLLRPLAESPEDPFGRYDHGHLGELGYRITAEQALAGLIELGWLPDGEGPGD